ncbi:hypothetical protein ACGF5T_16830 [Streptomyces sp. NPDC047853]|uniref:hypothetical protein n=2 Tax=unclassified Streptomyces TaxID=2593676 RepID=UPI00371BC342
MDGALCFRWWAEMVLASSCRLQQHISRLDATLTALVRAADPLVPDPGRTTMVPPERVDIPSPHGPVPVVAVRCVDPEGHGNAQAV